MIAPLLSISRRTRVTPFTPRVQAAGVSAYTVYNHMLLPTVFRSIEEDYWHLRRHVQIWDVAAERQVELRGPDAARLIQLMTPRDISKAVVGQCLYVPIVDEAGGMLNDPVALKLSADRFWLSIADSDLLLFAKGLAIGMRLDVTITEPEIWPLAVQGPKAETLVARVFGECVRDIRFFRFEVLPFEGRNLVVARSGWSKQGGFEIYLDDWDSGSALWDALWQAGHDLEVAAGCPNLIERVEGGLLSYGNDMTRANDPFECGLDKYCHVDRDIDCIALAALRHVKAAGPARVIRGVKFGPDRCPPCVLPWPIASAGRPAGQVSTAIWSPRFDCNVGFAMMESGYETPGTKIAIACADGVTRQGEVCLMPMEGP